MSRTLVLLGCFFLTGCTGVGLLANSVGDIGRDAQLDALEERQELSEQDRKALEARLFALQARIDELEKEGASRGTSAAVPQPPPSCDQPAIDVAAMIVHDD